MEIHTLFLLSRGELASATIDTSHFKGLKALAQAAGDRFVRGIVIYSGNTSVPFGSKLLAHPATEIWA